MWVAAFFKRDLIFNAVDKTKKTRFFSTPPTPPATPSSYVNSLFSIFYIAGSQRYTVFLPTLPNLVLLTTTSLTLVAEYLESLGALILLFFFFSVLYQLVLFCVMKLTEKKCSPGVFADYSLSRKKNGVKGQSEGRCSCLKAWKMKRKNKEEREPEKNEGLQINNEGMIQGENRSSLKHCWSPVFKGHWSSLVRIFFLLYRDNVLGIVLLVVS